jgi:pimeloyl-ACP methyl ester carboxylesterase
MSPSRGPRSAGTHDLDVGDVTLRYTVAGRGPVCLMHPGGPGVSPQYLNSPAVEQQVTAVYLDPAGTGGSGRRPDHPHGYTLDFYRRCAEAVIAHLDTEKIYFLGHSYGGLVGLRLALDRPGLLAGLICYDTGPVYGPELHAEAVRQVSEFARRFSGHPELPAVLAAVQRELAADATDEQHTAALRDTVPLYFADYWARRGEFGPLMDTVTVTNVLGGEGPFDFRPELSAITVPALILVGRYDFIGPPRWSQELRRGIPGSRLVTFGHSGHFAHLEEPRPFAAAIGEFVSQ